VAIEWLRCILRGVKPGGDPDQIKRIIPDAQAYAESLNILPNIKPFYVPCQAQFDYYNYPCLDEADHEGWHWYMAAHVYARWL